MSNQLQSSTYEAQLQAAQAADLSTIEEKNIVQIVWNVDDTPAQDNDGNLLMLLMPSLIDRTSEQWEQAFQLFIRESHEIREHGYRLIFIMSNFTSELWFAWWLRQMRNRLSSKHRQNLNAVTIVHPSLGIRAICATGRLIFGSTFWNALHYVDRVEELWLDQILTEEKAKDIIPQAVMSYEGMLVEEAEQLRELARTHGAPLAPREASQRSEYYRWYEVWEARTGIQLWDVSY